jgi:hypothetical protein
MNEEILIFIDDSGKLSNKRDKYVNYSAVIFYKLKEYNSFCNKFSELLMLYYGKIKEIKGSKV